MSRVCDCIGNVSLCVLIQSEVFYHQLGSNFIAQHYCMNHSGSFPVKSAKDLGLSTKDLGRAGEGDGFAPTRDFSTLQFP